MNLFYIYRNHDGDLQEHLKAAVGAFYHHQQQLPFGVVVHPTQVDRARAALATLSLSQLPLSVCGGCLASEVWLGIKTTKEA